MFQPRISTAFQYETLFAKSENGYRQIVIKTNEEVNLCWFSHAILIIEWNVYLYHYNLFLFEFFLSSYRTYRTNLSFLIFHYYLKILFYFENRFNNLYQIGIKSSFHFRKKILFNLLIIMLHKKAKLVPYVKYPNILNCPILPDSNNTRNVIHPTS